MWCAPARWRRVVRRTTRRTGLRPGARVAFLSGEPNTPGHRYRVLDYAAAAESLGHHVTIAGLGESERRIDDFGTADLVVIWRAAWSDKVAQIVDATRAHGAPIVYDIDDLLFEPELAGFEAIDGLRSQQSDLGAVQSFFLAQQRTLLAADVCTAPTRMLVERMAVHGRRGLVLPNGFDEAGLARAERSVAARAKLPSDGLVRIGYAAGTRTHQRDFAQAAGPIADLLAVRPDVRLVLFKAGDFHLLQVHEFPALQARQHQIEWRELRPVEAVLEEVARFDINIAPLQWGNRFCEAKSELKFFEAALVEVPTVASPTQPYSSAIIDGKTGLLASTPHDWATALNALLDRPRFAKRIAMTAKRACIDRYGAKRRQVGFEKLLTLATTVASSSIACAA